MYSSLLFSRTILLSTTTCQKAATPTAPPTSCCHWYCSSHVVPMLHQMPTRRRPLRNGVHARTAPGVLSSRPCGNLLECRPRHVPRFFYARCMPECRIKLLFIDHTQGRHGCAYHSGGFYTAGVVSYECTLFCVCLQQFFGWYRVQTVCQTQGPCVEQSGVTIDLLSCTHCLAALPFQILRVRPTLLTPAVHILFRCAPWYLGSRARPPRGPLRGRRQRRTA